MNKIKSFYNTKRTQKILATIIVIALLIVGVIFATHTTKEKTIETKNEDTSFEASVFVELTSADIKNDKEVDTKFILGSDIEVLDDKTEMADVKLIVNKPTEVSHKLSEGTYTLNMTSTPIESDGSTYKIPDKLETVEVSKDKTVKEEYTKDDKDKTVYQTQTDSKVTKGTKKINVTIELERIDVEDMSKEQLDAVITRIEDEAPGQYDDLVKDLNEKKETAESKPDSVEDVTQDSQAKDDGNTDSGGSGSGNTDNGSGSGNSGGSDSGGSSSGGSTTPSHTHTWTPQYTHHPAQAAQGYNQTVPAVTKQVLYYYFGNGHKISVDEAKAQDPNYRDKYSANNNTNSWTGYETIVVTPATTKWVETSPAKAAWDELIGYKCSCGAWK